MSTAARQPCAARARTKRTWPSIIRLGSPRSTAVRTLKIVPPFEVELHRLRIPLRMVQDHIGRVVAS